MVFLKIICNLINFPLQAFEVINKKYFTLITVTIKTNVLALFFFRA